MRTERINLWLDGEYHYPHAFGFQPNLHTYLHEDQQLHPFILIVPGGGYTHCAEGEGEVVAKTFFRRGYHAAVLTYTVNLLYMEPLGTQPLQDIARAVRYIRHHQESLFIEPDQLTVLGFSAGAHLGGSLAEFHSSVSDNRYPTISARPDRLVLCYPVISSGAYSHQLSFDALFGVHSSKELRETMSLEKHVPDDMCPVFLWQTMEDASVPVENSYLMAMALRQKQIPFEHHVFQHGRHGSSVATEEWANQHSTDAYTLEQVYAVLEQVKANTLIPADKAYSEEQIQKFDERRNPDYTDPKHVPNKEIAVWVDLCDAWLKRNHDLK